jgi:hypothetical protein
VLPEAQDQPACSDELGRCPGISLSVTPDLDVPEVRIGLGRHVVGGAAMPEAAVYEDSDLAAGEGDVDAAAAITWYGPVDPVTQSGGVQQMAQLQLGPRVTATVGLHVPADGRGASPRELHVASLLTGLGVRQPGRGSSVHASNVLRHGRCRRCGGKTAVTSWS